MGDLVRLVIGAVIGALLTVFVPKLVKWLRRFAPNRTRIRRTIEKGINREFRATLKTACAVPVLRGGIKVEWQDTRDGSVVSCIDKDGDILVRLGYNDDRNLSRSFAKALMLYLDDAFMPESRPFVGEPVHQGCKYTLAKELTLSYGAEAYRHFICDYLSPLLASTPTSEELLVKLEAIAQRSLFKTVLLRELYALSACGSIPKQHMRAEVAEFVDYVYNIADKVEYERAHGKEPPLAFKGTYIKVHVVLVKRAGTGSILPHVTACENGLRFGAKRVYVTGWGKANAEDANEVSRLVSGKGYPPKWHGDFTVVFPEGGVQSGVCHVFEPR